MSRLGQTWVAVVLTVSGALTGAAIALRWSSQGVERLAGVQ